MPQIPPLYQNGKIRVRETDNKEKKMDISVPVEKVLSAWNKKDFQIGMIIVPSAFFLLSLSVLIVLLIAGASDGFLGIAIGGTLAAFAYLAIGLGYNYHDRTKPE